jgi:hypothetical protein
MKANEGFEVEIDFNVCCWILLDSTLLLRTAIICLLVYSHLALSLDLVKYRAPNFSTTEASS